VRELARASLLHSSSMAKKRQGGRVAHRGPTANNGSSASGPVIIAVLNSNQDVLRLIRSTLEDEGYTVATEHIISFRNGDVDLVQFMTDHWPAVVVYDLAPPYKENWNFLRLVRRIPEFTTVPLVLTTVNKAALEQAVGETDAFELIGTRDNLAPVIERINRIVRPRR
jgi:CheY-like chemotaxis protein